MCLNRKQKMHCAHFGKNVQWWCSCTIIYKFYIKYSILFTLFHIKFFFTLPCVIFLQQNGTKWRQTMDFLDYLFSFFNIYICIYIYAYIFVTIRSFDKVSVCCGGEEGYHTYATVIYIITVWRVQWLGYTS